MNKLETKDIIYTTQNDLSQLFWQENNTEPIKNARLITQTIVA